MEKRKISWLHSSGAAHEQSLHLRLWSHNRQWCWGERFDCIYDGIEAMEAILTYPLPAAAAWTDINWSLNNNACGADTNMVAKWVSVPEANMYYIVYATTRDVAPGDEDDDAAKRAIH